MPVSLDLIRLSMSLPAGSRSPHLSIWPTSWRRSRPSVSSSPRRRSCRRKRSRRRSRRSGASSSFPAWARQAFLERNTKSVCATASCRRLSPSGAVNGSGKATSSSPPSPSSGRFRICSSSRRRRAASSIFRSAASRRTRSATSADSIPRPSPPAYAALTPRRSGRASARCGLAAGFGT